MNAPIAAFLLLCLVMTATPGLDTAMVIRNTISRGTRAGILTAMGCATGLFAHATGVAVGLSAVLLGSAALFEVVRIIGAGLLIVFGVLTLRSAWRGHPQLTGDEPTLGRGRPYLQGLATNLTNPKATLFFLSALPQFVPTADGHAVLAGLGLAVIAGCFSCVGLIGFSLLAARARRLLDTSRARRLQEAALGTVLIGLGLRVATE